MEIRKHGWVIHTYNDNILRKTNVFCIAQRQNERHMMNSVIFTCCILKLLLHSVNSVPILYRTGNMLSAILLLCVASSSLLPCGLQSTHPLMHCYFSPYVVYNVYDSAYEIAKSNDGILFRNLFITKKFMENGPSPIMKKLDFFRGIQNFAAPSMMEIEKIFTEMFLFLISESTQ